MRNPDIQNLRAFGLIAILLGHMPVVLPNILLHGYTFVSLFLAISGYFTVLQFEKRYSGKDFRGIRVFEREMVNRFFRLVPLMVIWIMLYYFVSHIGYNYGWMYGDEGRWLAELKSAALGYYNYYLAGIEIGGMFGQFWTLYVEIHLFIILILFRSKRSRVLILGTMIASVIIVLRPVTPDMMVRYVTHAQADSFLGGALMALLLKDGKKHLENIKVNSVIKNAAGLLLILILFFSGYFFDNFFNNPEIKYFCYTLLTMLILFLAVENDGWFAYKNCRPVSAVLGFLGKVSASTYVSHVLLFSCVYWNLNNLGIVPQALNNSAAGIVLQIIMLILAAALVGYVSCNLIEKPYGEFGKKIMNGIDYE